MKIVNALHGLSWLKPTNFTILVRMKHHAQLRIKNLGLNLVLDPEMRCVKTDVMMLLMSPL